MTTPDSHTLCGEFTYEATFMDNPIDLSTAPMSYDEVARTFTIYSEDMSLIGLQTFTLEAHLTDYPVTRTAVKVESA